MGRLNSRTSMVDSQMGVNLLEDMLLEKSHDLDKFKKLERGKKSKKSLKQISDEVIFEGKKFPNSQATTDDLLMIEEDEIKANIKDLMEQLLGPEVSKKVPKVAVENDRITLKK